MLLVWCGTWKYSTRFFYALMKNIKITVHCLPFIILEGDAYQKDTLKKKKLQANNKRL